jgi:FlaG/FlaF family flagellin (archaellin)
MIKRKDSAVSPVVGVMLMLVVVIIIAAIVSAFSGGIVQSSNKPPQATIQGSYSQSTGLTLTHAGGDALVTKDIQIVVRPSDQFGTGLSGFSPTVINNSYIQNNQGLYWFDASDGTMAVMAWVPGQSMYINCTDAKTSGLAICPAITSTTCAGPSNCNIDNFGDTINLGKSFILDVYSTTDGKMISESNVLIQP